MPLMDVVNRMVWSALKLYLPPGTRLTSVYRPPEAQFKFIVDKATTLGYRFARTPSLNDALSWQGALGFVRSKGYQVAAPGKSAHQRGVAYDLSGPSLERIEAAVRKAVSERRITLVAGSRSQLILEKQNHCVHVEIEAAILDYEPFDVA